MTCRLFSCLLISWLLYSCPVCAASIAGPPVRVHVWLSPRLQFVLCSRLVRVWCCWHTVCSGNLFLWEGILQSITVSSAYCLVRLAGCPLHSMHRGQPPLRRHRPVSTLVEASGLCCRGCRLITNRSVCLRRGGHQSEARRFRSVGWHSCPG